MLFLISSSALNNHAKYLGSVIKNIASGFSELLYFQGEKADGTFIGLWVPSILAFGIYLKLINNSKND